MAIVPELRELEPRALARVGIEARYAAFLRRQDAELKLFRADEELVLQPAIDYSVVPGLSNEERERLSRTRPRSIVRAFPP